MKTLAALAGVTLLLVAACSSEDDDIRVGVNDVRKACEIRATWTTPDANDCSACQTSAILERCECEALRDFSGACVEAANRVRSEASCTQQIETCWRACPQGDCACVDACYAGADACRRAAGGREGCVADVCSKYCGGA